MMFLKSDILMSPHAFSTRIGGVSPLDSTRENNLAFGRGDTDETVIKNLEIFGKNAGFDPESVISLPQIHSTVIHTVDKSHAGLGYYIREYNDIREGDGYVTNDRGIVLGVKGADCTPILFEARHEGGILAVGAVHSGWRGTAGAIGKKCVELLCENYGADVKSIYACIGPCIHRCCFEVGSDVYNEMTDKLGDKYSSFFEVREQNSGKYYCDLPQINRQILIDAGLPACNIDVKDNCTCCTPRLFYSHRYSGNNRGTMLNVIFMP